MMKTLLLPFAAEAVLDPGPSCSRRSSVDGAAAVGTTIVCFELRSARCWLCGYDRDSARRDVDVGAATILPVRGREAAAEQVAMALRSWRRGGCGLRDRRFPIIGKASHIDRRRQAKTNCSSAFTGRRRPRAGGTARSSVRGKGRAKRSRPGHARRPAGPWSGLAAGPTAGLAAWPMS